MSVKKKKKFWFWMCCVLSFNTFFVINVFFIKFFFPKELVEGTIKKTQPLTKEWLFFWPVKIKFILAKSEKSILIKFTKTKKAVI